MRPDVRVVAITDRRQMVAPAVLERGAWPEIAAAFGAAIARAVAGCPDGRVAVQVREKDLDGGALLALVRAAQAACGVVFVNDRLDVALAAGAAGVHLPERGLAIEGVRPLAPALAIGCSRHATGGDAAAIVRQAWRAGADLVQLGPIWPTPSKPGAPALGPAALAVGREGAVIAVGGIDSPDRAREARAAGATGVAVIRAAWAGGSLAAFAG